MSNGQSGATEQTLSTNVYSSDRKSRLEEVQYGNGGKVKYSYDDFDRIIGITHDNDTDPKFTYEYDAKGRAAVVTDTRDGSTIRNNYDQTDRPTESEQRDGNDNLKYRTLIEYDVKNRVKAFNEATDTEIHRTEYAYDKDNRPTEVKYNGSNSTKVNYTYDKLNRVTNRTVTNGAAYASQFGYVQGATAYGSNATTPLVQSITQGSGANALNFSYTYDSRGNITSETRNGVATTYEYDALGQLTRVNDPNDPTAYDEGAPTNNGTTWIYAYDRGGNILSKTAFAYTTGTVGTAIRTWLYEYNDTNWKDKLTKFDGHTITYDAMGNPLSDGTWTYTWQAGRQLKSMSKTEGSDTVTMEFTYNYAGLRTKKVKKVNGTVTETTEYILNGKNVVELIHTVNTTGATPTVNRLHFYYDAQGRVALVDFNGALYSYAHNMQGDIIGILDNSGNLVVEYKYDAWGKPISTTGTLTTTLGQLNPFKYRGYVWDIETKQYYLRCRYYIAECGRFYQSDNQVPPPNCYKYATNNPITMMDGNGKKAEESYTVIVNLHCNDINKIEGVHFTIQIDDVIFSFDDEGVHFTGTREGDKDFYVQDKPLTRIIIEGVPYEDMVENAIYEVVKMCFGKSKADERGWESVGIYNYFKELTSFDGLGHQPPNNFKYTKKERPCAWFVDGMLYKMELCSMFYQAIGQLTVKAGFKSSHEPQSLYYRAHEFFNEVKGKITYGDNYFIYTVGGLVKK